MELINEVYDDKYIKSNKSKKINLEREELISKLQSFNITYIQI